MSQHLELSPRHGGVRMDSSPIEWAVSPGAIDYLAAVYVMERRVAAIADGAAPELIWLLEHPALYTAGTSAREQDLLDPQRFPVYRTGRGGQFTYHGPGQRVVYVMLDVRRRSGDVRAFVRALEDWIIDALDRLGVQGETRTGRVGVWVRRAGGARDAEDKVAALGIRVRRWISYHGISLNVAPDLEHFTGIVPCGVRDYGTTSLAGLGRPTAMSVADSALEAAFTSRFGPVLPARAPTTIGSHPQD